MGILGERYQVAWLVGITILVGTAAAFAFRASNAGSAKLVLIYGGVTIALAIAGMIRAWRDGELMEWITPAFGDFTSAFFATALLFAGSYVFAKYLILPGEARTGWLSRLYLQLGDPAVLRSKATFVGAAICIVAIAEEILWRGLVTTLFAEIAGSRRAWIYAAILYSIAHVPTMWLLADARGGLNPLLVIAALGCGFVWGALARRNGRLVPGMISHALFDWCVIMMFRFWGPSV
jgi:membrane protease YdiL (CAAX protease family)